MVTLQDTIKRKQEDEAQQQRAHKQRLQMREYYQEQMDEKQKRKQHEATQDIYEKLVMNQKIILDKNKAYVHNL